MPILDKCAYCGRLGGYSEKDTDKVCMRCKTLNKRKPEPNKDPQDEDQKYKK